MFEVLGGELICACIKNSYQFRNARTTSKTSSINQVDHKHGKRQTRIPDGGNFRKCKRIVQLIIAHDRKINDVSLASNERNDSGILSLFELPKKCFLNFMGQLFKCVVWSEGFAVEESLEILKK